MLTIGGHGNLNGDYWKSNAHKWAERVELQAAWLNARRREDGLEWFGATELHAEKNAHKPLEEALGGDWAIETGPGGNLLIRVQDKVEVVTRPPKSDHLDRYLTKWNVRNPYFPETKYWLSLEHFTSGSTDKIEKIKRQQAAFGNDFLRTPNQIFRGIRMGDFNSWESSDDPTTPRGIMRGAGWRSLKNRTPEGSRVNFDLNTGLGWGHSGRWIEDMLTYVPPTGKSLVDVVYAQLWDARDLTDHSAFFIAKFNVHDKIIAAPIA